MVSCEALGSMEWKQLTVSRVGELRWASPDPSENRVGAALWNIVGEGISEGMVLCRAGHFQSEPKTELSHLVLRGTQFSIDSPDPRV